MHFSLKYSHSKLNTIFAPFKYCNTVDLDSIVSNYTSFLQKNVLWDAQGTTKQFTQQVIIYHISCCSK